MQETPCPRCQDVGLVRFETVIKGGASYQLFYCGRCDVSWRSAGVRHTVDSLDRADDKPEPSRPTKKEP
jgi:hypothetical protein